MKTCPPCHGDCNQGRTCPADPPDENKSPITPFLVIYIGICLAALSGWALIAWWAIVRGGQ